ncbi:MAG: outer membrane lipoprotein carrier protein LolA [Tannerella sp.]|jgi:outer membrane lipoprotein-sorting protein|nr:outer membrane lipoprotein carrier protein LolA [Tannerella sp.]
MRKNLVLLIGLLLCSVSLPAQYQNATEAQKKEIVDKITQAAGNMNTMQGDFIQVKELSFMDDKVTSEGRMFYKKTNKIRWEYTKPYQYVFSMDGQNVRMTSGDKTNKVPVSSSKMFGEISKVMVGGVSGSGLVNSPDFDTQFMVGSDDYKIVLTPKKKEIKDMFSSVQLYIGKSDNRIRSVELVEKSGDKTTLTLKNVQVNATINDDIFTK